MRDRRKKEEELRSRLAADRARMIHCARVLGETVRDTFSPTRQTSRHPWMGVATAVAGGLVLGGLAFRKIGQSPDAQGNGHAARRGRNVLAGLIPLAASVLFRLAGRPAR